MKKQWWLSNVKKLKGVTSEQMKDYVFCEALDMAISCAVDKWECNNFRKGRYFFPDIKPSNLIVRFNDRTNTIHIRHRRNPFIKMTEKEFNVWIDIINEEIEVFGIIA